jgi:hypothetical protein
VESPPGIALLPLIRVSIVAIEIPGGLEALWRNVIASTKAKQIVLFDPICNRCFLRVVLRWKKEPDGILSNFREILKGLSVQSYIVTE